MEAAAYGCFAIAGLSLMLLIVYILLGGDEYGR